MAVDFDRLNSAVVRTFGAAARGGAKARYLPQDNPQFDVDGIFDRYFVATKPEDDGEPVSVRYSALSVRTLDMPPRWQHQAGDQVRVTGVMLDGGDTRLPGNTVLFDVADVQPDGQGMTVLLLTLA